jgi:3-hydroxyisobutyrate dehydrogenase-like beta-hydroxyacid dehydrogenase
LNLVHNCAAAEAMVLGMKSGLDPKLIHEAISGSGSSSAMFEVRGAMMAAKDYRKGELNFSIPLKDARIISEQAASVLCPLPIYQVALQQYYAAVAQGHFDEDHSAVCAAMERAANCER